MKQELTTDAAWLLLLLLVMIWFMTKHTFAITLVLPFVIYWVIKRTGDAKC